MSHEAICWLAHLVDMHQWTKDIATLTHGIEFVSHLDCLGYVLVCVWDTPVLEHELEVAAVADNIEPTT